MRYAKGPFGPVLVERKETLPNRGGFSPPATRLTNEQLGLLALCRRIAKAPVLHTETPVGLIQQLTSRNDDMAAIEAMGSLLAAQGLSSGQRRYPLDAERFKSHREIAGLTQADLAERLTVKKEQISHYETGRSGIGIESLLLVLSIFGIHSTELLK